MRTRVSMYVDKTRVVCVSPQEPAPYRAVGSRWPGLSSRATAHAAARLATCAVQIHSG